MSVEPVHEPRRRGRRPAGEDARGAILAAARAEFGSRGYDGTTMRGVARAAGVDARLVHHYFDGKDALFVAALELPVRPADLVASVVAGPRAGIGSRLVLVLLSVWDSPAGRDRIVAFLSGALTNDAGRRLLREFLTREIFGRLAAELGLDDDAPRRCSLASTQLVGLAMTRAVVGIEPLASAAPQELAAVIGPVIEHYLFDALP